MSKSFSQLVEQLNKRSKLEERRSEADDPYSYDPKDDETKSLEPRAKGERDFKGKHSVEKKKHPVASDDVFQGATKPTTPKGEAFETIRTDWNDSKGKPTPNSVGEVRSMIKDIISRHVFIKQ